MSAFLALNILVLSGCMRTMSQTKAAWTTLVERKGRVRTYPNPRDWDTLILEETFIEFIQKLEGENKLEMLKII